MSSGMLISLRILAVMAAAVLGLFVLIKLLMVLGWIVGLVSRGVGAVFQRIGAFLSGMLSDAIRLVGHAVTGVVLGPMILVGVGMGRWSRANHYGRALEREAVGMGSAAWRLAVGHPARLLGLENLVEGVERRLPEIIARAPGPDSPGRSAGFDGYTITGSLPSGGSGARLFLATPSTEKRAQLLRTGLTVPDQVVIKSFSMAEGSSMPQIVRESRALEAARNLGLVLEHSLSGTRFHYVMPYVPGEDLGVVTQRLHAESDGKGLGDKQLARAMDHAADLLTTLHRFHAHGLWHKDVKPTNIIVSGGRVHLVDLGLTTPLASAMTLTTHGTEYFRDPELVRLALRGVKVHEVDGVKFDVYGAGAVLYSLIENGFPAHGSLSQITRRCPEALRWVVRRAMADMTHRYSGTTEMLADLRHVMAARDPFKVKPAQLPSMLGRPDTLTALEAELAAGVGPLLNPAPAARVEPRGKSSRSSKSARRPRGASLAAGVVAAGLVVAALSAAMLVRGGDSGWATVEASPPGPIPQRAPSRALPARDWVARRPELSVLLVLDDVPAATSAVTRAWLDDRMDALEQARFQLVGAGRTHGLGEEREIALRAHALNDLGLTDPREPEAVERLTAFLLTHQDELDGLLWLGRGGDDPDDLAWQLVPTRREDAEDVQLLLDPNAPPSGASRPGELRYSIY